MPSVDSEESRPHGTPAPWVRPALVALAAASAGLLAATLVVTWHNLRYAHARILDVLGSAAGDTAGAGLELTRVAVPDWVAPFLQDLSVVSPALVLFALARVLVAAVLLLRQPRAVASWGRTHFPFPDPYKVYFIQMGLLGTIVGFVLAFAEVDPRAERQSIILLEALGTALWSTLTAIALAYVVCPLIEAVFLRARAALQPPEPRDTRSALDALRLRTAAAAAELDALAAATRTLAGESRALGAELHERRLDSRVDGLERRLGEVVRGLDDLRAALQAADAHRLALQQSQDAVAARLDSQAAAIAETKQNLAPLASAVAELGDAARRAQRTAERLAALEDWLRTPPRPRSDD